MRMFHGTTDAFADSLGRHGLVAHPPARTSAAAGNADLIAYPGVYLATAEDTAEFYARQAAAAFGGHPVLVEAEIDPSQCHPDEDEVLFVLQGLLTVAMEDRDCADGLAGLVARDGRYRRELAARGVGMLREAFEPDTINARRAAGHLENMLLAGASAMDPSVADLVGGSGWITQAWAVAATRGEEELASWRFAMDALCRCVVGPRPTDATCGLEAFKLRVPFDVGHEGICRILSISLLRQPAIAFGI